MQIIVDDYMKSESVLKASRMHDELDLDGELCREGLPCMHMTSSCGSVLSNHIIAVSLQRPQSSYQCEILCLFRWG